MNKLIKTAWIAALRGKKYTQVRSALRTTEGHCCLAVLADVMAPGRWRDHDSGWGVDYVHGSGGDGGLSGYYRRKAGLTAAQEEHLIELNDDKRKTFRQIANYAEKHL